MTRARFRGRPLGTALQGLGEPITFEEEFVHWLASLPLLNSVGLQGPIISGTFAIGPGESLSSLSARAYFGGTR